MTRPEDLAMWHHPHGDINAIQCLEREGVRELLGDLIIPAGATLHGDAVSALRYLVDEWGFREVRERRQPRE